MSNADMYKLLRQLNAATEQNKEVGTQTGKTCLTLKRAVCTVDESWIQAIERGLTFVGNAIGEERRFIRSEGEVQFIERVKRISKESVRHLARHSEFISREPSDDDIVPDKLFTVERLNDYATYENRFLYRLLVTVKSFLNERYFAIVKAMGYYSGELSAEREFSSVNRNFVVTIDMKDVRQGDGYLMQSDVLSRLDKLNRTVDFYLHTPLMTELAKVDTVQRLVKNNVLKMDKNFSEAVKLYDWLLAYEGKGFSVAEEEQTLNELPYLDAVCQLVGFATYVNGLNLTERLEREMQDNETSAIARLKEEGRLFDYIAELEKRSARLELAEAQLQQMEAQLQLSGDIADEAQRAQAELTAELEQTKQNFAQLAASYAERLADAEKQALEQRENFDGRYSALSEQNMLLKAQIAALNEKLGQGDGCYSEADFDRLEELYEILGRVVNREWKGTRAMLKKQYNADLIKRLFGKRGNVQDEKS